jgi:hypothetical protein
VGTTARLNKDDVWWDGGSCMSDEGPVMGLEQRAVVMEVTIMTTVREDHERKQIDTDTKTFDMGILAES